MGVALLELDELLQSADFVSVHTPLTAQTHGLINAERLALLKALGDQVNTIRMGEPPTVQMQDLVRKPFKSERIRRRSEHEAGIEAAAWWQIRICDLQACVRATHLYGPTVRFGLQLDDPITCKLQELSLIHISLNAQFAEYLTASIARQER